MKKYIVEIIFLVVACGLLVYFIVNPTKKEEKPIIEQAVEEIPEPVLLFGLPIDSFDMETSSVLRNQNLSDILVKKNIS